MIDAKLETVGVWAKTKEDPPPAEVTIATPLYGTTPIYIYTIHAKGNVIWFEKCVGNKFNLNTLMK